MPLVNQDIYRTLCEKAEMYDHLIAQLQEAQIDKLPAALAQASAALVTAIRLTELVQELKGVLDVAVESYSSLGAPPDPEWLGDARKVLEKLR